MAGTTEIVAWSHRILVLELEEGRMVLKGDNQR